MRELRCIKYALFVVCATLIGLVFPAYGTADWPNEPAGSALLGEWGINSSSGGNGFKELYGGSITIVSDATAPLSPPYVMRNTRTSSSVNAATLVHDIPSGKTELYAGYWFKPSDPHYGWFNWYQKISLIQSHVYAIMYRNGLNFDLKVVLNDNTIDNRHVPGCTEIGTFIMPMNVKQLSIAVGQWHKVEIYYKKSTNNTSRDGVIVWWVDGTLVGRYTNVNLAGPLEWFGLCNVWDSTYRDLPFEEWVQYDHVRVSLPNGRPLALTDTYSVAQNQVLSVPADGVLGNDIGPNLTAIKVTDPSHGSVAFNSNGSFTYTPATGYSGSDSFTYKVHNSTGDSSETAVNITVMPNWPSMRTVLVDLGSVPTLNPGADGRYWNSIRYFDVPETITDLVDSANAPTGLSLTKAVLFPWSGNYLLSDAFLNGYPNSVISDAIYSTSSSSGKLRFYNLDTSGDTTYNLKLFGCINDGNNHTARYNVIGYSATNQQVNVRNNKTIFPTFNSVQPDASGNIYIEAVVVSGTYAPINLVQMDINHRPWANNDSYSVISGQQLNIASTGLLSNDNDSDSQALTAIKVSDPTHGSVTVNADGSFTYTPAAGYTGSDSFTYKANDGFMDSNVATVNITVTPPAASLTLASPNGGEVWTIGSSRNVTWTTVGSVGNVDIELSTNGGSTWRPAMLAANTANDGTQAITVPDAYSKTCRVRVKQTSGGSPADISDANFTITVGGDATLDGYVDGLDFSILLTNWHTNGRNFTTGDFTGDGYVDGLDFSVLLTNWHVRPTPASNAGATGNALSSSSLSAAEASDSQAAGTAIKVNFQPAGAAVPTGCLVDSGLTFAPRGNGYSYGWTSANTTAADRNSSLSADQRYDTLVNLPAGNVWEIALPNGTYSVKVVCGDAASTGTYKVNIETVPAIDGRTTTTSRWIEQTMTVVVTDGKLTISAAAGSSNAKICFVEIAG